LEVDGLEIIWIEVFVKRAKSLLFGIAYKPPESSKYVDKNFAEKLDSVLTIISLENKETIFTGDLNCNYMITKDQLEIKNMLKVNGLKQLITEPTRTTINSRTLIDIVSSNVPSRIAKTIVYSNSMSDHDMVGGVRKMNVKKYTPRKIFVRDYSNYNSENF
jgi:hypothetical protein